jgi:putative transposase
MPQSLSRIILHVIFSTKGRCKYLTDAPTRDELQSYLVGVFINRGATPLLIGIVSDHVHILCLQSKDELISKTIGDAKRSSSIWIKGKWHQLSDFHWQRGYGVFSVSESNIENVRNYILRQEEHHKVLSFQDEFRNFLKKHNIEYNEQYVWD